MDCISDQLANGRRFRVLNIVDDYSRECKGQIVDFSISGLRLSLFLESALPCQRRSWWTTVPKPCSCGRRKPACG